MLNYEIKEYKSAVDDFKKALDYSEGNAILYFNLGMAYFRMEEAAEACPWFNKSCQLGNENACRMILMECAREIPDVR
jgi:tetratricopeptide (TPR) repeat protein